MVNNFQYLYRLMADETELRSSRLLLPPVRLYSRNRTSNQIISKYLHIVKNKKHQLQEQLIHSSTVANEPELHYVRDESEVDENSKKVVDKDYNALSEELMARGSSDQWIQQNPQIRRRLVRKDLGFSRIEEQSLPQYKICLTENSVQKGTPVKEKRINYRYSTQPSEKSHPNLQIHSFVVDYKNKNETDRIQSHQQRSGRKSKPVRSRISEVTEIQLLKNTEQSQKSRQEIAGEDFTLNPTLCQSKYHSIQRSDASNNRYPRPNLKRQCNSLVKADDRSVIYPQISVKAMEFIEAVSVLKKSTKTNERLERTQAALEEINPFFKKIERVIGVCLLRIGSVVQKYPNSSLYQKGRTYPFFFIVLYGKIKLIGKDNMHKFCQSGETLLEEVLFDVPKRGQEPLALEKAKVMQESWLLRVDLQDFQKLEKELVKYGFKQGLIQLKNIMRRNQIVKNWIRNKCRLLQGQ